MTLPAGSASILILKTADKKYFANATKCFGPKGVIKQPNPKFFTFTEYPVKNIREASELLTKLENQYDCASIGGRLKDGFDGALSHRRLLSDKTEEEEIVKATIEDCPRHLLFIDLDKTPTPAGLDPQHDPETAIRYVIEHILPKEFHDVTMHAQWSASMGIGDKGWDKLKLHLWYWLDKPYTCKELEIWAETIDPGKKIYDHSVYTPNQLRYTAKPILQGIDDSVSQRSVLLAGSKDCISLLIPDKKQPALIPSKAPGAPGNTPLLPEKETKTIIKLMVGKMPTEGEGLHQTLFELAGGACKDGLSAEDTVKFITEIMEPRKNAIRPEEIREVVERTYERAADGDHNVGWSKLSKRIGAARVSNIRRILVEQHKGKNKEIPWQGHLLLTEKGTIRATLGNAMLLVANTNELKGRLAFDERSAEPYWTDPPPWELGSEPREVKDFDGPEFSGWIEQHRKVAFQKNIAMDALVAIAHRNPFDRVRDYLISLKWDGELRLDEWLTIYLGAELGDHYTSVIGAAWLISAVARTFQPGCKADHMLVLEGPQGSLKSTSLEILAGKEYYAEVPLDVGSKDSVLALHGPWIIEWSELAGMGRREAEQVKSFLSRPVDRIRTPYGRLPKNMQRHCVIAGTTNDSQYLSDSTGNRRYWPVKVGTIDLNELANDRDQLWAEAVQRYRDGAKWWLDITDERMAQDVQKERLEVDAWETPISDSLETGSLRGETFVTTEELLSVLDIRIEHQHTGVTRRLARVMRRLGWARGRKPLEKGDKGGKSKFRGYLRPVDEKANKSDPY